jgi:hypothetical protein
MYIGNWSSKGYSDSPDIYIHGNLNVPTYYQIKKTDGTEIDVGTETHIESEIVYLGDPDNNSWIYMQEDTKFLCNANFNNTITISGNAPTMSSTNSINTGTSYNYLRPTKIVNTTSAPTTSTCSQGHIYAIYS